MVSSNQILTVSYGTFSCTLEGFDDPFNTMKSIAEYFRNLASEDRFFGAEPPQPDAEMLGRIAQRQVQHRVEAEVQDRDIVLRQITREDPATLAPPQPESQPESPPEPVFEAVDSVDSRLGRIRDAVTRARADRDTIEGTYEEDEPTVSSPYATIEEAFSGPAFPAGDKNSDLPQDDLADVAELADRLDDESEPQVPLAEALADDDGAQPGAVTDDALAGLEIDQPAPAPAPAPTTPLRRVAPREAPRTTDEPAIAAEDDDTMDIASIQAAVRAEEIAPETAPAPEPAAAPAPAAPAAQDQPAARIIRLKRSDFDAAISSGELEALEQDRAADPDDDTIASFAAAEREAEEAEIAASHDEPLVLGQGEALETDIRDIIGGTSLSDDEEEELLRELANVERDAAEEAARLGAAAQADAPDEDAAISRLMSQTDEEFDDSEGSRRRSAIAHFKAAVAATKADGGPAQRDDKSRLNQYRDDLAQVVRPRRPQEKRAPHVRPEDPVDRPAPLVLVSEQRIDESDGGDRDDQVRPRRVSAMRTAPVDAGSSAAPVDFAAFAQQAGAQQFDELIEAAAAYSTLVSGRDSASRPEILRFAATAPGMSNVSREEGLREFSLALRAGRIERLGGGRYRVSSDAPMAKLARAIG